jgi:hypothetical protein
VHERRSCGRHAPQHAQQSVSIRALGSGLAVKVPFSCLLHLGRRASGHVTARLAWLIPAPAMPSGQGCQEGLCTLTRARPRRRPEMTYAVQGRRLVRAVPSAALGFLAFEFGKEELMLGPQQRSQ